MFLAGVGTLLPWNVFITERAYFDTRLAVPPATPALSRSFESVFGITYMFANTFALAAMVKFDGVTRLHRLAQVPLPLLGMAALLAFTGALTHAVGMSGDATMAWSLATLVCLGALTALVQGGSFGAASCLPPRYNQAIMSGQAVAGVVSAVVALASTLGSVPGDGDGDGDGDDSAQASTYFFTAAALLAACHVGCLFLPSVPFYRHHAARAKEARKTDRARRRRSRHRGDGDGVSGDGDGVSGDGDENSATAPLLDDASFEDEEAPFDALAEDDDDDGFVLPAGRTREGEMSLYRAAVCATFATTLTVFPAVTSAVCSARNGAARPPCVPDPPGQSRLFGDLWVPSLFLLFNVGDLCGRCAANAWPRAPRALAGGDGGGGENRVDSAPPRVQRRRRRSMAFPALVRGLGPRPDRARRRPRLHQRTPRERVRDVRPRVGAALAESRGGIQDVARRRRGDSDGMRLVVRSQRRDASVRHERERG